MVSALAVFAAAGPASAEIFVSADSPKQGQTVEIYVSPKAAGEAPAPGSPAVVFNGRAYQTFPVAEPDGAHRHRLLVSIPADLRPGTYAIRCGQEEKTLRVLSGRFPVQRIRLPAGKDNFVASPGEVDAVDKAKATVSDSRLWKRSFAAPVSARISTVFGVRRVVNGHLLADYFHSGIDFAAPAGAPVRACAPGRVILAAQDFKLHGKTVAIDHGQGVVSFYIHLQKLFVKAGDTVSAGQLIGRVGQTGRANGPHLHFSIYVNQVATNPLDWFKQEF